MRRQVMRDWGAPWNSNTGGPEPPITVLISAPVVLILSLRKPGGNRCFHAGSLAGVCAAAFPAISAAAPEAKAACCSSNRRVALNISSGIEKPPEINRSNSKMHYMRTGKRCLPGYVAGCTQPHRRLLFPAGTGARRHDLHKCLNAMDLPAIDLERLPHNQSVAFAIG